MVKRRPHLRQDQRGLASILVTLILMLIISLIVVGFARLARREQRQTLDDQLSTQAFYAAESGINDAVQALKSNPALGGNYTGCGDFGSAAFGAGAAAKSTLDSGTGVKYTCLLVNMAPDNLKYNPVNTDNSTIVSITPQSGQLVNSVTIGWQDPDPANKTFCTGTDQFKPQAYTPASQQWPCPTGVLRADVLPGSAVGNRATLNSASKTVFLFPSSSADSFNYDTDGSGEVVTGNCDATHTPTYCSATISFGTNQSQVYLRLRSIYRSTSVNITATKSTGGAATLTGTQAIVDATGQARDVLRRIQVRVPIGGQGTIPEYAIQSGDSICKRLLIDPTNGTATNGGPLSICDPVLP